MKTHDALARVLEGYRRYYTIEQDHAEAPFQAEAAFWQHDERYFLSRRVRLSETDSREYVFFSVVEKLDAETFRKLDRAAWTLGLQKTVPAWGQQGTDITLVILTGQMDPAAATLVRAANRSKGYFFSLKGWSNYRVAAIELPTMLAASNRLGRITEEALCNILRNDPALEKNGQMVP